MCVRALAHPCASALGMDLICKGHQCCSCQETGSRTNISYNKEIGGVVLVTRENLDAKASWQVNVGGSMSHYLKVGETTTKIEFALCVGGVGIGGKRGKLFGTAVFLNEATDQLTCGKSPKDLKSPTESRFGGVPDWSNIGPKCRILCVFDLLSRESENLLSDLLVGCRANFGMKDVFLIYGYSYKKNSEISPKLLSLLLRVRKILQNSRQVSCNFPAKNQKIFTDELLQGRMEQNSDHSLR